MTTNWNPDTGTFATRVASGEFAAHDAAYKVAVAAQLTTQVAALAAEIVAVTGAAVDADGYCDADLSLSAQFGSAPGKMRPGQTVARMQKTSYLSALNLEHDKRAQELTTY
jgi:monomeric isocitrate dehydrogenase